MPAVNALSPHRLDFALIQDDSSEKQQQDMNQVFLHDILNTAGGIKGVSELLREGKESDDGELKTLILTMATQLVEEITAQRDLVAAESGNLEVNRLTISSQRLFQSLVNRYRKLPVAEGLNIVLDPEAEDVRFVNDPRLIERVLSNMLINALEAETEGATITVGCNKKPGVVQFWIHNPGYISPENQSRIFDCSFSTKGHNRGLGTYSMLLLTERFLNGSIGFCTDPDRGTTFHLNLPDSGP